MRLAPLIILLIPLLASPAAADTITLRDGRILRGAPEEDPDDPSILILRLKHGAIRIPRADVISIRAEPEAPSSPSSSSPSSSSPSSSSPSSSSPSPDPSPAPEAPGPAAWPPLELPPSSPARLAEIAEIIPRGLTLLTSGAILLATDRDDPGRNAALLEALDAAARRIAADARRLGLPFETPAARLELVLFAREADFRDYLLTEGLLADHDGLFSRSQRRCFLFDMTAGRAAERREELLAPLREEARELELRIQVANVLQRPALRRELKSLKAKLTRSEREMTRLLEQADRATAIHELTHLLAHEAHILPRDPGAPTWLREGLALLYEELADRDLKDAAPLGQDNPLRRKLWAAASAEARERLTLEELLSTGGPLLERGGAVAYAKAWILFSEVWRDRRLHPPLKAFLAELDSLCARRAEDDEDEDGVTDDERLALFQAHFGELEAWRRRLAPRLGDDPR